MISKCEQSQINLWIRDVPKIAKLQMYGKDRSFTPVEHAEASALGISTKLFQDLKLILACHNLTIGYYEDHQYHGPWVEIIIGSCVLYRMDYQFTEFDDSDDFKGMCRINDLVHDALLNTLSY